MQNLKWGPGYLRGYLNFQSLAKIFFNKVPMIRGLQLYDPIQKEFINYPSKPPRTVKLLERFRNIFAMYLVGVSFIRALRSINIFMKYGDSSFMLSFVLHLTMFGVGALAIVSIFTITFWAQNWASTQSALLRLYRVSNRSLTSASPSTITIFKRKVRSIQIDEMLAYIMVLGIFIGILSGLPLAFFWNDEPFGLGLSRSNNNLCCFGRSQLAGFTKGIDVFSFALENHEFLNPPFCYYCIRASAKKKRYELWGKERL
ncbi:unnamed protein product [Orchesella dallaii]|uniref:Uncharacterized protein n=1 Tax=Orchesella dallaii TaxID=48710 RepID=A0ABP1RJW5_9HEXA